MAYRFLPHTADIKVAFEAESLDALLMDGLVVLRWLLAGESPVESRERRALVVTAVEPAELFLGFLREVLFLHATDGFLPADLEFASVTESAVEGTLLGEPFDSEHHEHQPEVKAVTRHGLVVERGDGMWTAEVVFDV
ncbi:MAG: archease [Gemmatimonadota bacterium]|nr:archease [Gemmatimonadota bacterium]MDH3367540.1 archease [Gemmatimonadota bacterium]MDH3479404.1 archease [Gemmatimonadota bacterium]MDH3571611.1 archease [Gemmatimonadota bacterium]MDH5550249.1 archease [Gemmatimonadota bacterium]